MDTQDQTNNPQQTHTIESATAGTACQTTSSHFAYWVCGAVLGAEAVCCCALALIIFFALGSFAVSRPDNSVTHTLPHGEAPFDSHRLDNDDWGHGWSHDWDLDDWSGYGLYR
ncbi:MAG: hypothetical protein Q4B30_02125 [Coriobacteriaceae bacterium]|nr:hypothetical protein [Coriobacteriaceae bacterium]